MYENEQVVYFHDDHDVVKIVVIVMIVIVKLIYVNHVILLLLIVFLLHPLLDVMITLTHLILPIFKLNYNIILN